MTKRARPGVRHAYWCEKCHARVFLETAPKTPPVCKADERHGLMIRQKNIAYLGQRTEYLRRPKATEI